MFHKNKNNDMQKAYFKTFNKIYFELLEFIKQNSNDKKSFKSFYMKNYMMKKANIKPKPKRFFKSPQDLSVHTHSKCRVPVFAKIKTK